MCRVYQHLNIRRLYDEAYLCLCDSKIIQFLSFFSSNRIKHVVRGSDLTTKLLRSFSKNEAILIVGSEVDHANKVGQTFGLENVQCYVPPMGFIKNEKEIDNVFTFLQSNSQARIVFLAVGSPQQELIASQYHKINNDKLLICCGNAINFAIGNTKRAPSFMSEYGLEWLYRMVQEPIKMVPRYISNLKIFFLFFFK